MKDAKKEYKANQDDVGQIAFQVQKFLQFIKREKAKNEDKGNESVLRHEDGQKKEECIERAGKNPRDGFVHIYKSSNKSKYRFFDVLP